MRTTRLTQSNFARLPDQIREGFARRLRDGLGLALIVLAIAHALALATWSAGDPSLSTTGSGKVSNLLGYPGAVIADLSMQLIGLGSIALAIALGSMGLRLLVADSASGWKWRLAVAMIGVFSAACLASALPATERWPLPTGLGGAMGDGLLQMVGILGLTVHGPVRILVVIVAGMALALAFHALFRGLWNREEDERDDEEDERDEEPSFSILMLGAILHFGYTLKGFIARLIPDRAGRPGLKTRLRDFLANRRREEDTNRLRREPVFVPAGAPRPAGQPLPPHMMEPEQRAPAPRAEVLRPEPAPLDPQPLPMEEDDEDLIREPVAPRVTPPVGALKAGKRERRENQISIFDHEEFQFPPLSLLAEPKRGTVQQISTDALEQNARLLESVLEDFGVRGEIINVRPGPVVTLYELEPAPGTKSSRVIGLAEDIARSMSAVAARVAVIPGRNAIGIELPNAKRETVYLRELLACEDFEKSKLKLSLCLGKTIGGEPVIVDLARMPHLLVAGTTGSGKSVAINTMICSLLYRLRPEECRLIMIDPKMLELSIYEGIPHLLTPVVTDPKKAVVALKWAVREMEDRYRKMSKVGVRNIDGFNARIAEATEKGEVITRTIQTGYDPETGEAEYDEEMMALEPLPYIVVIVDEMADLMLVAGKEIEGAVQRLAQMARAAGIHLVMATQRPSVDVITGTIKANFPTRISFQVTSKIDSRTILGEQGAEQLLGQGDMLYMAGGGRISRVHGPFVADGEVEKIVSHLKTQGRPAYIDDITAESEAEGGEAGEDVAVFDHGNFGEESAALYDQAIAVVLRDRKASTSYIQRRLQIGYNRAASLIERMEREGIVGPANHAGKREILLRGAENGTD
ncbi:MAG: DNA translocase FtsK 4TM domain-containing protein [Methylobacterium sp.]|nr:DNA translocase FtsK 4TM domain-containing protein [Methylobacterium sp.]